MRTLLLSILFLSAGIHHAAIAQMTPKQLVMNIQVAVNPVMHSVTLTWQKQTNVSSYNVSRKLRGQKTFSLVASNLPLNDTSYTDFTVAPGTAYEYCVQSATDVNISGYVYAGIQLPPVHQQGELLLLVDSNYVVPAQNELEMYKLDLIKEGWKVSTAMISRSQSIQSVKSVIMNHYNLNPTGLKGVILLGHIPVPYSGKIAPDAHADHVGAWPCDMYYGDLSAPISSGSWIDVNLTSTTATDIRNHNVIGDGKFDASNKSVTSAVQIFVGRIDVYNMPAIHADDTYLFKQYLTKNHAYRAGITTFRNKAVIDDNFGFYSGEAFAQNGWRNFSSLLGTSEIEEGDLIASTTANSYLWSYACGPGWYTGASGIGNTSNFSSNQMKSVFTMTYGSYFGDWDNQNNFLRAPIASPSASLVSVWGGRPNWFFHTMSMGEPIGYSYLNSVDNADTYFPKGFYFNKIHQAMHGDPSLTMFVYNGASSVTHTPFEGNTKMQLSWTASADTLVSGYYVYRAASLYDSFELIDSNMITGTTYTDQAPLSSGSAVYMIRAVKLQSSTSGTFYNLSPGATSTPGVIVSTLPVTIRSFDGYALNSGINKLNWTVIDELNLLGYDIQRSKNGTDFITIGFVKANSNGASEKHYELYDESVETSFYYRLRNVDIDGQFSYSQVIQIRRDDPTTAIRVFPVPFKDQVAIAYPSTEPEQLHVDMFDVNGVRVQQRKFDIQPGITNLELAELDRLKSGFYLISVFSVESGKRSVIKVLKE